MTIKFGARALLCLWMFYEPSSLASGPVEKELWSSWSTSLGTPQLEAPVIHVEFENSKVLHQFAGRTLSTRIQINKLLSESDRQSVIRHELAHVFINQNFTDEKYQGVIFNEALALALSGDSARIARLETSFVLFSEAKSYLRNNFGSSHPNMAKFEAALSKMIENPGMREKVIAAVKSRASDPDREILNTLLGRVVDVPPKGPLFFIVKDLLTHEVLKSENDTNRSFDVGSILKPALLASFPSMMREMRARNNPEWACPKFSTELANLSWNWRSALVHSCNGFFLDQQSAISDWSPYKNLLGGFIKPQYLGGVSSVSAAIGLSSQIKMSVGEVADFYQWFVANHRDFVDPLTATAREGTLSAQPDSKFFTDRKIAMKSGSVRAIDGSPVQGWIVSLIADEKGEYRFVAVIAAPGYSGVGLLPALKTRLKNATELSNKKAHVQILGLVGRHAVDFQCGKNDFFDYQGLRKQKLKASEIKSGHDISCAKGPLQVSVPYKNREAGIRKYWGKVRYSPRPQKEDASANEKEKLARGGSDFILETSERSYVAHSLVAESANSRNEVLKALALVMRQNLRTHRHGDRPVCDTTHCQLFNTADWASDKNMKKYFAVYDEIASEKLENLKPDQFLNFSLGGSEPWTRDFSKGQLSKIFNMQDFASAHREGNFWVSARKNIECERIRGPLHLPSCPDELKLRQDRVSFSGHGEGHNLGLDLSKAEVMAAQGKRHREILKHFYE